MVSTKSLDPFVGCVPAGRGWGPPLKLDRDIDGVWSLPRGVSRVRARGVPRVGGGVLGLEKGTDCGPTLAVAS